MSDTVWSKLKDISVNDDKEQKGDFDYLSWTDAIKHVKNAGFALSWEIRDDVFFPDGTMEVRVDVTINGDTLLMWLPVMNHRNQAIKNPNAFEINKTRMRCLVKGIAAHGLGFYIYAGEDLPVSKEEHDTAKYEEFMRRYVENKHDCAVWYSQLTQEEMSAIKDGSPKNKKTATQTLARDVVAQMHVNFDDYAEKLSEAVIKGDAMYIEQLQGELEEYERNCVKERLSAEIKQQYRVVMENAQAMKEKTQ